MTKRRIILILIGLAGLSMPLFYYLFRMSHAASGNVPPSNHHYIAENVVLVVIDGPRWTETWGDPEHKYIPHMANDLAKEGAIYTHFSNNGKTLTVSGHSALTTGFYERLENSGKQLPWHPTVLQMYLKFSQQTAPAAELICSKDKLNVLSNCESPAWKDKYPCVVDCGIGAGKGARDDKLTTEAIKARLTHDHPRLVVINLMGPDVAGHGRDWEKFLANIQACDQYAWEIWQTLQSDPFYANKTAFFISNDHGRHADGHADGFCSHGDDCPSCRHINFFAAGRTSKKASSSTSNASRSTSP